MEGEGGRAVEGEFPIKREGTAKIYTESPNEALPRFRVCDWQLKTVNARGSNLDGGSLVCDLTDIPASECLL